MALVPSSGCQAESPSTSLPSRRVSRYTWVREKTDTPASRKLPGQPRQRKMSSKAVESHRRFLCARCGAPVILCTSCDRGNRYCGQVCSSAARREGVRNAQRRYQQTVRGRQANAERQRRYRARHAVDVTHHGSNIGTGLSEERRGRPKEPRTPSSKLTLSPGIQAKAPGGEREASLTRSETSEASCTRCRVPCGRFTRFSFLPPSKRSRRRRLK